MNVNKRGIKQRKKAQFYLLAAAIIIAVIVGIAVLVRYTGDKPKKIIAYDLSDELGLEASKVIDYGIYQEENTTELIENFSDLYITKYGESKANVNWYLVYGDEDGLYYTVYNRTEGGGLALGRSEFPIFRLKKQDKKEAETWIKNGDKYSSITVNGNVYEVKINPGKVFYFVLEEYVEGEKHIVPG